MISLDKEFGYKYARKYQNVVDLFCQVYTLCKAKGLPCTPLFPLIRGSKQLAQPATIINIHKSYLIEVMERVKLCVVYTLINRLKRKNITDWLSSMRIFLYSNLLKHLNLALGVKNGFIWINFFSLK